MTHQIQIQVSCDGIETKEAFYYCHNKIILTMRTHKLPSDRTIRARLLTQGWTLYKHKDLCPECREERLPECKK